MVDRVGSASLKEERVVHSAGAEVPGRLVFLGFGVSRYAHVRSLAWAAKDATDLGDALALMKGRGFSSVESRVWVDSEVGADAFVEAARYAAAALEGDTLVVLVAGHGAYSLRSKDHFFAVHGTRTADLERTAVRHGIIEALFEKTRARRRLLLIDTCESGEVEGRPPSAGPSRPTRGLSIVDDTGTSVPVPMWARERSRYIFNELGDRTGAVVITSSLGHEASEEDDAWQNGAFTESVMRSLATSASDVDGDGMVSANELFRAIGPAVESLTSGAQHPDILHPNPKSRLAFPVIPEIAAVAARRSVELHSGPRRASALTMTPTPIQPKARGCACDSAPTAPVDGSGTAILVMLAWRLVRTGRGLRPGPCNSHGAAPGKRNAPRRLGAARSSTDLPHARPGEEAAPLERS